MRLPVLLLLLAAAVAAEPLAARVDRLARPYRDGGRVAGMVVAVHADGEDVFLGYGDPLPDRDTVYEIGSVSKVFTGVLLASMAGDGTVRLEQPVAELLPEGVLPGSKIALVDLSTHTSGLPRMPNNFEPKDPANPYADYTVEQLYAFLNRCHPARAPKEDYEYSNLGAGLLGHALARKAGKSYEALLAERVTGPLGMASTVVALTPALKERLAPGHDYNGHVVANWDLPTFAGAGGIRSTAADMMVFLKANLEGKDDALHRALAEARKVHWTPPDPRAHRLGLGWHISPLAVRWHNGQTGGYHAFAAVDPERGQALVILANSGVGDPDELARQILRMLHGEKVEPLRVRKEIAVDPEALQAYAGTYRILSDVSLTVTVEDGKLMVQATNQAKFQVYPEAPDEFFYKVVDAQLTFVRGPDGKVASVVLHQNGQDLPGKRE